MLRSHRVRILPTSQRNYNYKYKQRNYNYKYNHIFVHIGSIHDPTNDSDKFPNLHHDQEFGRLTPATFKIDKTQSA